MVYLDGDNDLYQYAIEELNALLQVNSSSPLIVLFDGKYHGDSCLYIILNGSISSISLGEINMGDWKSLNYLLNFSKSNYKGKYYMLEIWSHGNGWMGVSFDRESFDELKLDEINKAIYYHINIIFFSACYMGNVDVAYWIKNKVDYMIAPEGAIPVVRHGKEFYEGNISTPEEMCKNIIDFYRNNTYISTSIAVWNIKIIDNITVELNYIPENVNLDGIRDTASFSSQYADLYELIKAINFSHKEEFLNYMDELIVFKYGELSGIGIYFPLPNYISRYYSSTPLSENTIWDELITSN